VLLSVLDWKQKRRPPIEKGEVALAIRNLAALRWLDVKPSSDLPIPAEGWTWKPREKTAVKKTLDIPIKVAILCNLGRYR
jgi:hypothetical protein